MEPLWRAAELAVAVGSRDPGFDVTGVAIDTRLIVPGDLFVALRGERDGHEFVADALAKGAAGALVSQGGPDSRLLRVDDTLAGLNRLGEAARARTGAKIIAVTGSVGKTTTKEMLRRVLRAFGVVHAAEASFNNHIGVPLTLARLPAGADFAVLEIGMNHPGEILPLAMLARPDVAVVTAVERVHIGLMGSLEVIATEKASIFSGLATGGAAVFPAESDFAAVLAAAVPAGARHMTFGATGDATLISAESDALGCDVHGCVAGVDVRFRLNAPGAHMASNALTALAVCAALGLDVAKAAAALDGFAPFAGRGARREVDLPQGKFLLLDESYNASAASIRAALAVLALQPGRHVAVLGDMLELGDDAEAEHLSLLAGMDAADLVFTCGPMMGRLFAALPAGQQGAHRADAASLAPVVRAALRPGDSVLVKGSYGSRMRDVIAVLESPG
jgi:UDP-N-acetylmuramoyl-tripeptide--D-alanyl-D-alanine ligase